MQHRTFVTRCGEIHYWVGQADEAAPTMVFLPGLTADHRLFDQQIACFENRFNVLVWDPPSHGASWPFEFDFTLMDQAEWVHGILEAEGFHRPVLIGQSMGGYVAQAFAQQYPESLYGLVSIDSAPLQRKFITAAELWLLKRMGPVYRWFPWKWLLRLGSDGVAVTPYGQSLMREIMMTYDGDQKRYAKISGHGFRMLAEAIEKDLPYAIPCPALLICGRKDRAGSCIRYSKAWHKATGIPLAWIEDAGHNANTDQPEVVNRLIEDFVHGIESKTNARTL